MVTYLLSNDTQTEEELFAPVDSNCDFYSSRRRCLGTVGILFFLVVGVGVVVGTLNEIKMCVSFVCILLCILLGIQFYKCLYTCIHVCIRMYMSFGWLKHFSGDPTLY